MYTLQNDDHKLINISITSQGYLFFFNSENTWDLLSANFKYTLLLTIVTMLIH